MSLAVALTHNTRYRYDRLVSLGPQTIRLRPAPHARTPVLAYTLAVAPQPYFINWQQDPQRNHLARVVFPERVRHFDVTVDFLADMATINPFDFFQEPDAEGWPFSYDTLLEQELAPFRLLAPAGPRLQGLLNVVPRGEQGTVNMLVALNPMVQCRVAYIVRMEPGVWTPEQMLAEGRGSCRDSAWLLVQLLRHLGYAARFVSDYLVQLVADVRPLDGPAGPAADGIDLHAGAEAYLPGAGWAGLDATPRLLAGEGHIPPCRHPRSVVGRADHRSRRTMRDRVPLRHARRASCVRERRHGSALAGLAPVRLTGQPLSMSRDEMVDGKGGLRPQWRGLLGVLAGLGHATLAERGRRLDRVMEEEGVASLLPGSPPDPWRFDPIPLLLSQAEFATLDRGLAQRARLLDAILADLYGPQELLARGVVPPALVYANPDFLRPCRHTLAHPLQFYAADLARSPGGAWTVLADRTSLAEGLAHALQNRRQLGRVIHELFASQLICHIQPFVELCQEQLQRMAPDGTAALLTPGHADPAWYGHVLLARELSCALVEGGDLTVRDGGLFLKTLRGPQPIDVLLRGIAGGAVDPLELDPDGIGVPGLLAAARESVRIVNGPGSGLIEAPAFAAFLPDLARLLLGEALALDGVPTVWLDNATALAAVLRDPAGWCIRSALDPALPPAPLARMAEGARRAMLERVNATPWQFCASAAIEPSVAPCLGKDGEGLVPRPVLLRLFLLRHHDGWRAMPGGLGCVLAEGAQVWPSAGPTVAKDVWVLAEDRAWVEWAHPSRTAALAIRRVAGDLPSRVADNFFWLGRYLERLEAAARLLRIAIGRVARPAPTPHEMAELDVLAACLTHAGLLSAETSVGLSTAGLGQALLQVAARRGAVHTLLGQVSRVTGLLRDRVTGEMHAVTTRGLREVEDALGRVQPRGDGDAPEAALQAMSLVLTFAAALSGLVAENMVRGGGRLFLDLGRRVERAQAVAEQIACVLQFPGAAQQPARVEHGLRLALELCDSSITYRSRYLSVLQPAPALDLLLADEGNPRGLAFQLAMMRSLLSEIGSGDATLAGAAAALQEEPQAMVRLVSEAADQAVAAQFLPVRLRALRDAVAELSDRVSRRYFALLPTARIVGTEIRGGA